MNFKNQKTNGTSAYPVHAEQTSGLLRRVEPFLTPEQLVSRFLKGINLMFSSGATFTNAELKDRIYLAMNEAEIQIGTFLTREAFKDKLPFDSSLYRSYIHLRVEHGPIISVEEVAIVSANNEDIFRLPPQWIEAANFSKNLINIIPLLAGYGFNTIAASAPTAGVAFLSILNQGLGFVPAYWQVKYTAGVSNREGEVPTIINELVGCIAAIAILSEIAPWFVNISQSQSQDGISQSSSSPGPRIYELRIAELTKKRDEYIKKIKGIFSTKFKIGDF